MQTVCGFIIEPGRYVKIDNGYQRFWMLLIAVYDDRLVGEVQNEIDPRFGYGLGEYITFSPSDIVPDF